MSVTLARARELFDLVNATICCPGDAMSPCIPFLYPDDGCWGRAHEMCRLMEAAGAAPNKVWIFGNLHVVTANNPQCHVDWGWHVAPTLDVESGSTTAKYVIDPALFDEPVPQATWAGVQGDPSPTLIPSPAEVFFRDESGATIQTDPTYSLTNSVLADYRNFLMLRAAGNGPPPYTTCMVKPARTQWFGTIPAGASQRWFTWGWSASAHVVWTIMPLTPCPGSPQLSWDVAVERADGTTCTYWITVNNLTAESVQFEGRFDVL
jgi:Glutaminase